jgi:hypothetical protein
MAISAGLRNGLFAAFGLVLVLLLSAAVRQAGEKVLENEVFCFGAEVRTLIVGDSHSASSIDPAIFPHAANIAEPSENYLFTYYKLRHFLHHNPEIERVILAFSYHNCARVFSERYLFDERFTDQSLPRYYPLLGAEAKRLVRARSRSYLVSRLKFDLGIPVEIHRSHYLIKAALGRPLRRDEIPFYGGYYAGGGSNVTEEDIAATLDRHYFGGAPSYRGVSPLMVEYLHRIAQLCRDRGIALYLFNAPLYSGYLSQIPDPVRDDFETLRDAILEMYSDIIYLDYAALPLEKGFFGDVTHLNTRGAERISRKLALRIYGGEGVRSEE